MKKLLHVVLLMTGALLTLPSYAIINGVMAQARGNKFQGSVINKSENAEIYSDNKAFPSPIPAQSSQAFSVSRPKKNRNYAIRYVNEAGNSGCVFYFVTDDKDITFILWGHFSDHAACDVDWKGGDSPNNHLIVQIK